jgi:hypothetical protein
MIRGGEGLICNALLPRAALSQVTAVTRSLALGYILAPLQG